MKYSRNYHADIYHCDYRMILLPSFMGRFCHETAYDACYAYGPNPDWMIKNQLGFVLSRISYRMFRPIYARENLEITTWAIPSKGIAFSRFFEIRANDIKIAEAASVWGLLSLSSRTLVRIDSSLAEMAVVTDDDTASVAPVERWKLPGELEESAGTYTVRYTDIDINRHLNNVLTMDIIVDSVAGGGGGDALPFAGKYISGMDINFTNETTFGQTMRLCTGADGETKYLRAVNMENDIQLFESRIRFDSL